MSFVKRLSRTSFIESSMRMLVMFCFRTARASCIWRLLALIKERLSTFAVGITVSWISGGGWESTGAYGELRYPNHRITRCCLGVPISSANRS